MRASEALRFRSRAGRLPAAPEMTEGGFNVSVKVFGRTYSRELTRKEIKEAYGHSLLSVKRASRAGVTTNLAK